MKPRRGEVWLVDLGMATDVPAVVVSIQTEDADRALVTIVSHTTSPRHSRFEASVSVPFLGPGAFDVQALGTVPHERLVRQLGTLGGAQLSIVERALRLWLGLPAASSEP